MRNPEKSNSLKVPGATLYYEVRGSGPVLLLIPGGPTDAGIFAGLAACLADHYTVVAYDVRGNSRSTFDGAPHEQDIDVHGDDAARLIEKIGDEPAFVFGSSGGAQIGLDLAARHPARVRALLAHEPPCVQLLPDAVAVRAQTEAIHAVFRCEGVGPAMQKFAQLAGMSGGPQPPRASREEDSASEMSARIGANMDYFFAHGLRPISFYMPDVSALGVFTRVAVGVGEDSVGQLAYRSAIALAEKLGSAPVVFPGGHGGYGDHPAAFAQALHRFFGGGR